ncbi:nitroreductase family deazaflavin-dependent oxidoreductase [Actinophytocola sp.]|uniref:nitroreductase family deazaflavin-dependent oxidoreductase n=1 Tax=Actinophytocola sp. TaxID=1872138 RepID=UPI002ED5DF68
MPLHGEYAPSSYEKARKQVKEYESSGGTSGTTMHGLPVVILTSKGAKTGKIRKSPLMRVEHEGRYAAVASMGGAPVDPLWAHNLRANPEVELQDGPGRWDMVAHEATGEERLRWWEIAVAAFSPYAEYQTRTDRQIPVFVLTRKS